MRYSMLVYLSEMSATLLEAAQYLRTAEESRLREELVGNGRQMLHQMRTVLERYKGDLRSAAPLERLKEISRLWGNGRDSMTLEERIKRFSQCLPGDVFYQVRGVFFAELGEKWDAMESVYAAMRADPRFDPIVVRTPVYRAVNENGRQRQEVVYRDFLTPLGVPSLEYNQYQLEEDCPDLAFISQPYESCTPREFWPGTIAKHTRLVYLPYFLPSIVLNNYPDVLCRMPVYDVSWKVIGSGRKHLAYYQKYSRHGGANMLDVGVPKTDPIIWAEKAGVPIPESWEKIRGKKAILWNSWFDVNLSSLRFFDEIWNWFQAHTDLALIWRPHPMTESVTKVYYPERLPFLRHCERLVEASPNAVLDRETSFLAAFVRSYAQLSDHSSLMQQYLPMNKPLLWFGIPSFGATGEEFISTAWMERGETLEDILRFLERMRHGIDPNRSIREAIRRRDLPLADGHCGERVCQALWNELHLEDHIPLFT